MQKKLFYLFLAVISLCSLKGCIEDRNNYDYIELNDFYVDTSVFKSRYLLPIFATFELQSGLVYEGDRSNLEFLWRAYTKDLNSVDLVTLSEEENLSAMITMVPGDYLLEFRATEKDTRRIATFQHRVTVESTGSGMLVLYEENGEVDCGLISPRVMFGSRESDIVFRRMYTSANPDYPLTGKAIGLNMYNTVSGTTRVSHLTLLSDSDGVHLSPFDMKITEDFSGFFAFPPATVKPEAFRQVYAVTAAQPNYEVTDPVEMMINDGALCVNVISLGLGQKTYYSERTMAGGYKAAPYIIYGQAYPTIYDLTGKRFLSASLTATALTPVAGDLGAVGKELVYMDYAYGGQYNVNGIFKDTPTGTERYLYIMRFPTVVALLNKWDISSFTGIVQAELFAFSRRSPLAYYMSGGKIYLITYNSAGDSPGSNSREVWAGLQPGETITAIKLCPHPGRDLPAGESALERYMFVGAWNESTREGKVYMLRVNIESDGSLVSTPVGVYDGFGKVKDFGFKF